MKIKKYSELTCVEILCGGGDVPVDEEVTFLVLAGASGVGGISRGGDGPTPVDVLEACFPVWLKRKLFLKLLQSIILTNRCITLGLGVLCVLVAISDVRGFSSCFLTGGGDC